MDVFVLVCVRVVPHGNRPTLSGGVARPLLWSVTIVTKYMSHVHSITLVVVAVATDDDDDDVVVVVLWTVSCPAVNATDTSAVDGELTTDVMFAFTKIPSNWLVFAVFVPWSSFTVCLLVTRYKFNRHLTPLKRNDTSCPLCLWAGTGNQSTLLWKM